LDFTFEILDPTTINVRFNYGGEWFEFNLYSKQNQWILHPFDASLLGNPDMFRLVVSDLLAHKPFQVMLAKERIMLSQLRTSIDVSGNRYDQDRERGRGGRYEDEAEENDDPIEDWIRNHTFDEILAQELQVVEERLQLFNTLLQKMFYENLGPGNLEFDKVQEITRIYKDAAGRLDGLIDPDSFLRDRNKDGRRF